MELHSDTRRMIAEIDFGGSLPGVLVVRETRWQRIVGVVAGFVIGVPAAWAATLIALYFNDPGVALFLAALAAIGLGGSVWLLHELLNAGCYYVALDNQYLYRRRGPRRLTVHRVDELADFAVKGGTLFVSHLPSNKRITVIKNAYAPEDISKIARRLTLWRVAPPEHWQSNLARLNTLEAEAARVDANRRIARGLGLLCLYPLLIVLTSQLKLFQAPVLSIALWGIYTWVGLMLLAGGLVRRVQARLKGHVTPVGASRMMMEE